MTCILVNLPMLKEMRIKGAQKGAKKFGFERTLHKYNPYHPMLEWVEPLEGLDNTIRPALGDIVILLCLAAHCLGLVSVDRLADAPRLNSRCRSQKCGIARGWNISSTC